MNLLSAIDKDLFKNINEINGFKLPDNVCVFGKEFECFEQLGADLFFSNYWIGKTKEVNKFAEDLAMYFKDKYGQLEKNKDEYDFQGLVMVWNIDDKNSLVGNVNLFDDFSFWGMENEIPEELKDSEKNNNLKRIMSDGDDNCVVDILYDEGISKTLKKRIFNIVADLYKEDYISIAEENNVEIEG